MTYNVKPCLTICMGSALFFLVEGCVVPHIRLTTFLFMSGRLIGSNICSLPWNRHLYPINFLRLVAL